MSNLNNHDQSEDTPEIFSFSAGEARQSSISGSLNAYIGPILSFDSFTLLNQLKSRSIRKKEEKLLSFMELYTINNVECHICYEQLCLFVVCPRCSFKHCVECWHRFIIKRCAGCRFEESNDICQSNYVEGYMMEEVE